MVAFYVCLQYVPSIIGDERIIFGVITFYDDDVHSQFLEDWSRVEAFALEGIDFLKEFAQQVTAKPPTEEIRRMANTWHNGIQVTQPRASLIGPARELLKRLVPKTLVEPRQRGFTITTTPL